MSVLHTSSFGLDSATDPEVQTSALQKAVDHLQDDDTLIIDAGAGSYTVNNTITLKGKRRVSVMAERGALIKQSKYRTTLFICCRDDNSGIDCEDLVFDGLSLEGFRNDYIPKDNKTTPPGTTPAIGIWLRNCTRVILRNLTLRDFSFEAIWLDDSTRDVTITDCTIVGTGSPRRAGTIS